MLTRETMRKKAISGQKSLWANLVVGTILIGALPVAHAQEPVPVPATQPSAPGTSTPSAAAAGATMASMVANNMNLENVVSGLSHQTKVSISAHGQAALTRVSFMQPKPAPLAVVLDNLASEHPDWVITMPVERIGTYEIWDAESLKADGPDKYLKAKSYHPKHISVEQAAKSIPGAITKGEGAIAFDPSSNKVIITDYPDVVEQALSQLQKIDVPAASQPGQ